MTMLALGRTCFLHLLLAQGGDAPPPGAGSGQTLFIGLILAMVVFWLITLRGGQRDRKKRQEMLDKLAKGDRILTIGGIIGTVVALKGDEITVKVDETNNTKITIIRSAIQKVLTPESGEADRKK